MTNSMRAIVSLSLAMLFFAIQDALFKHLVQDYAVLQLLLVRMSLVVCALLAVFVFQRRKLQLRTQHWKPMMLRGCLAFTAFTLYYLALQKIPLAEGATVLMSAPLFVTALSVPLLGEKVGIHRWIAVCVGFIAVLFMLKPGTGVFRAIMILPLISAVVYSFIPIITRKIKSTESAFTITFYTTVAYWLLCVLSAVLVHSVPATENSSDFYSAIAQPWRMLKPQSLIFVGFTSALFCISILLITVAYRSAQASAIASFEYSYLVWAMLVGYLLFGDIPTVITCLAAAVIAGCGIYITWREHRLNVRSQTPAAAVAETNVR